MKNYIDFRRVQVCEEQIQKQIAALRLVQEEIRQAEEDVRHMSYMEKTRQELFMAQQELAENIRVLSALASVLEETCGEYRRTEAQIIDRYNLDIEIYPDTRFEVSRITGMEQYRELMPF